MSENASARAQQNVGFRQLTRFMRDADTNMSTKSTNSNSSAYSTSMKISSDGGIGMNLKLNDLPKLYGRDKEIDLLNRAYDEAISRGGTFVALYGKAGSGKSALIESLRHRSTSNNDSCFFASGKFDQNQSSIWGQPFSGIIDALRELIDMWLLTPNGLKEVQSFVPKVKLDHEVLCAVLPQLSDLYQQTDKLNPESTRQQEQQQQIKGSNSAKTTKTTTDDKTNVGVIERDKKNFGDIQRVTYQLLSYLCRLSSSKTSSSETYNRRRIVLFLDDIQWADTISLSFLEQLAKKKNRLDGLLLAVSYREEERFNMKSLKLFEDPGSSTAPWRCCKIHVQDLDLESINELVSTVTKRECDETLELSKIVHKKTGGNSFFVLQFLQHLEDEKFLNYSYFSMNWEWGDVTVIDRFMNVSDSVVDIIATSMRRLEQETLQVLMIASCFGHEIPFNVLADCLDHDATIARVSSLPTKIEGGKDYSDEGRESEDDDAGVVNSLLLLKMESKRLKKTLDSCVAANILGQLDSTKPYKWLHDNLQQVAYSLIPESGRGMIHYRLGTCLSMLSSSSCRAHIGEEWMIYMAADQINKAFALSDAEHYIINTDNSIKNSDLNLRAAKLSISKSAFYPAIDMLAAAVQHLDQVKNIKWNKENYNLCLDIYSTLAEMNLLVGNHVDAMFAVLEVLSNAAGKREDKFRAQYVHLKCAIAGADRDYAKGIAMALDILADYNVQLPRKPNKFHIFIANQQLRLLLPEKQINDTLLSLPVAVDEASPIVATLLGLVAFYAVQLPDAFNLCHLASIKALQIAYTGGVSGGTAHAILWLAFMLNKKGRPREACDKCELAVRLCDQYDDSIIPEKTKAFVEGISYGTILPSIRPLHECLEPMLTVSQRSFRTGDTEFGILTGFGYCWAYFAMGLPLEPILSDLVSFADDARQFGIAYSVEAIFHMIRQTILNLHQVDNDTTSSVSCSTTANTLGDADDDLTMLNGDAMAQDEMLSRLEGRAKVTTLRDINTFRLILACIFHDYTVMEAMLVALADYRSSTDSAFVRGFTRVAFMGLASIRLGRRKNSIKYMSQGIRIKQDFKAKAKLGSMNAVPIVHMLEAEENPTKRRYDQAIAACGRSGLKHYQALMYESAGLYFLEQNDEGWGEFYLKGSLDIYQDWGAWKKVDVMKATYAFLTASAVNSSSLKSSTLKGRSRHQGTISAAVDAFKKFTIAN